MRLSKYFFIFILFMFSAASCQKLTIRDYSAFVNPFIGTGGHGHTFPGAVLPFGMMQLSPDTRLTGWDGCSGYHFSDSVVYGFTHTHLSGTGVSDYGDVLLIPCTGNLTWKNGNPSKNEDGYFSYFSHDNEIAEPGYYSTFLDKYKIKVELTATERAGMHKYTFPKAEKAHILLDLEHRDQVLESHIKIVSPTEIEGYRISSAWAKNQYIYFVVQFSSPFENHALALNDSILADSTQISGTNIKAAFFYKTKRSETISLRIGISAVDIAGARANLNYEIKHWDFDSLKMNARNKWNAELSKVEIKSNEQQQKLIFYTGLYHSFLNPHIFHDVDGRYRGGDLKIHHETSFKNHSVFSLWDTFRATHPLFTILQPDRTEDFIQSMLKFYEYSGFLPVWELAANETTMIGYHSVSAIADAYLKGIRGFDAKLALKAMVKSAEQNRFGLDFYQQFGFIPLDKEPESVSKTLEYAYDDWAIALMAKELGQKKIYRNFIQRAQYYKNIFDPQTGFMRPKSNGAWLSPFDPKEVNFNYTEANSWQYSFFVPQDVSGFMQLLGGSEYLEQKLDALFSESNQTTGRTQVDITGLIGQYAHGNEPSHHMVYLYNYVGKPWKTQHFVNRILNEMYTNDPNGLIGNEDCGQMSSWYVLSALGFYQLNPGADIYAIGTPIFPEAVIHAGSKPLVIKANNVSTENYFIQSVRWNGEEYKYSYITHKMISDGGELVFEMGSMPNMNWGEPKVYRPVSEIADDLILPVPYFSQSKRSFYDTLWVALNSFTPETSVFYTLDGSEPTENSNLYTSTLIIDKSLKVKAIAVDNKGRKSKIVEAEYHRVPAKRSVQILSKYNRMYTAGGDNGLVDFLRGGNNFRNGLWQGYQNQDFEAIVKLEKTEVVSKLGAGFLQEISAWIWMPLRVDFLVSTDGINFDFVGSVINTVPENSYEVKTIDFVLKIMPRNVRYVRVKAYNYGTIPEWHLGHGGDAFIFVDEIIIE